MKHLKRIFEDKNFRKVNETILDECEMIQHFIDEFEERGDISLLITCGNYENFRSGILSEFKNYVNQNIENHIDSIQYAFRGSFKDKPDILLSFVDSLKSGLKDTFCRFSNMNITDSHKYIENYTKGNNNILKKNQTYKNHYLITETYDCIFSIQLSNTKKRYFESNPELFKKI